MKLVAIFLGGFAVATAKNFADKLELIVRNMTGRPDLRALSGSSAYKNFFVGYGCHCQFDNAGMLSHSGKGHPLDKFDQSCKQLRDNYECIMHDAILDGNDKCVPWEVEYGPVQIDKADKIAQGCAIVAGAYAGIGLKGDYHGSDQQDALNECVEKTCVVETQFLHDISKLILLDSPELTKTNYDEAYKHGSASFDSDAQCVVDQGVNDSERDCCGEYPTRSPYKPQNGNRVCCDGIVRPAGTC